MLSELLRRWSVPAFLVLEAALYLLFLYLDLFRSGAGTVGPKYAAIALCCAMSLAGALRGGDRLVAWAMALTLGADTLLLLLNRWYLAGILLFYGVQVLYLFRICKANGGKALLIPRMLLFVALLCLLIQMESFTPLTAAAALYITHFLLNTLQSLALRSAWGKLFSMGLILYFCCDLCVGIFQAPQLFPPMLYAFARVGMWLFYLPGQVLIVLSGLTIPVRGVPYEA